jgi:hypothetical protein
MHGNQTLIEHRNEELTCGNVGITSSKSILKHFKGVLHVHVLMKVIFEKSLVMWGRWWSALERKKRNMKRGWISWGDVAFFSKKGESSKMNKSLARGNRSRRFLRFWRSIVHIKLCVCGWRGEWGVGERGIVKEEVNISVGWISQFNDIH